MNGGGGMVRTQQAIYRVVNVAIMQPFDLADNTFQLESQSLGDGPTARICGGAFDGNAVEFPRVKDVKQHRPATSGHDALALMRGIQPIAQCHPTVWPVQVQMTDHAAKLSLEPDARRDPPMTGILLLPDVNDSGDIRRRVQRVHPRMPDS